MSAEGASLRSTVDPSRTPPPVFYLWDSQEAEDLRSPLGSYLSEREDGAEPLRRFKD